ncbi:MAG: hypothetical protein OXD35_10875, partial [Thiotrichales bacterium]|nr:hypothetical protein [Thiotrichales bacterium]
MRPNARLLHMRLDPHFSPIPGCGRGSVKFPGHKQHTVDRSTERGWELLENGALIRRAEEDGQ